MATLYMTSGAKREVKPEGASFSLSEVQALVGGYVESMPANGGFLLFDEDGRMKAKPTNPHFPPLVGDVLHVSRREFK